MLFRVEHSFAANAIRFLVFFSNPVPEGQYNDNLL